MNAVGGFVWQTTDGPLESGVRMHRMNLTTVLNVCCAALPHLTQSSAGRIFNVGARGAVQVGAGMGAYAGPVGAMDPKTASRLIGSVS